MTGSSSPVPAVAGIRYVVVGYFILVVVSVRVLLPVGEILTISLWRAGGGGSFHSTHFRLCIIYSRSKRGSVRLLVAAAAAGSLCSGLASRSEWMEP